MIVVIFHYLLEMQIHRPAEFVFSSLFKKYCKSFQKVLTDKIRDYPEKL